VPGASFHLSHFASRVALMALLFKMTCVAAPVSGYKVVAKYPHSIQSYTEGFFYLDGLFYEGTGLNGRSAVLVIQPESGKPLQHVALPTEYFGEGIID
jgi:glutamine cyclotransferase